MMEKLEFQRELEKLTKPLGLKMPSAYLKSNVID